MKHIAMLGIFLWSLVCAQACALYEGKVVGVSGRLAEIDAPEKRQPYGQRSKQSLSELVYGKQVKMNQQDRDRYGRVVGRVYAGGLLGQG